MTPEQRREKREQKVTAAIEEYVQRRIAETPPLTEEEKRHLARLLTAPRAESAA